MNIKLILKLTFSAFLIYFIFQYYINIKSILDLVTNVNYSFITLSLLCILIMILLKALRLHLSLNHNLDFSTVLSIYSISNLILFIFPFRTGEAARPLMLKRNGVSFKASTLNLLYERLTDIALILTVLILFTAPDFLSKIILSLVPISILVIINLKRTYKIPKLNLKFLNKYIDNSGVSIDLRKILNCPPAIYLLISFTAMISSFLGVYFLYLASHTKLIPTEIVAISTISALSTILNITPGGAGIREIILLNLPTVQQIPPEVIILASVLDNYILPVILLGIIYLVIRVARAKKN